MSKKNRGKRLSVDFSIFKEILVDVTFEAASDTNAPPDNLCNISFPPEAQFSNLVDYLTADGRLAAWTIETFRDNRGRTYNDKEHLAKAAIGTGANKVEITIPIVPTQSGIQHIKKISTEHNTYLTDSEKIEKTMKQNHLDFATWLNTSKLIYQYEDQLSAKLNEFQQRKVYCALHKFVYGPRKNDTSGLKEFEPSRGTTASRAFEDHLGTEKLQMYLRNPNYKFYEDSPLEQKEPFRFIALFKTDQGAQKLERIWVTNDHYENFKEYTLL